MARANLKVSQLQRLLFLALTASGCTGVLNDPAVQSGSLAIVLNNDEPNKYMWKTAEEIKGNKYEPVISGDCGTDITQITVEVTPQSGGTSNKSFTTTCKDGHFSANFAGADHAFTENGLYRLRFYGVTQDITQTLQEVIKVYNLYRDPNPSQMVSLECLDRLNSDATIPLVSDTCTIDHDQALKLSGLCTPEATDRGTVVRIKDDEKSCASFYKNFDFGAGAHIVPVTWIDLWGNTYSRNILTKKLDIIDWEGSANFIASGQVQSLSGTDKLVISMASGQALVPDRSAASNEVPFSQLPRVYSSGGENARLAPGYMSLVYGLSDGD